MKEKIRNWWIRNKNSDWLIALLLTCVFTTWFLIISGIIIIIKILFEINTGLAIVAILALLFLVFLTVLKVDDKL